MTSVPSTTNYDAHQVVYHTTSCLKSSFDKYSANTKRSISRAQNPLHSRECDGSSTSSSQCSTSSVKFDKVMIREYQLTAGDNPSCSSGVPICLNWQYDNEEEITLDLYETHRGERRAFNEMKLPAAIRYSILKNDWGISMSEIREALKECKSVKEQRYKTAKHAFLRMKFEKYISDRLPSFLRRNSTASCNVY
mmetsp:Transcript_14677/g.16705  ORF Transcript_14677/g.16705 Transcript_14677/m.16705 type:complete len:194 (+) Transcript_14677:135-716(+)